MNDRLATDLGSASVAAVTPTADPDREDVAVLPALSRALRALRSGDRAVDIPRVDAGADAALSALCEELRALVAWLDRRFDRFLQLQKMSEAVAHGLFVDDVLDRVFETFRPLIPYNRIGFALLSADQKTLTAQWARTDYPSPRLKRGFVGNLRASSLRPVLESGQPRILNDLQVYLAQHPGSISTRLMVAEGVRSSLTCPVLAGTKPIGFLFFSSFETDVYSDVHQEVFLYIAGQLGALLERSRLYQNVLDLNEQLTRAHVALQEQSMRDALTGVLNRGAICGALQSELGRSKRKGQTPGVLMIDVDLFKQVNDTHGHLAGDAVLREVARVMLQTLRRYDQLGRFGGEEFLILLPDTDREGLLLAAERVRSAVAASVVHYESKPLRVTVSIGAAMEVNAETSLSDVLLRRADAALYRAKAEGRNRVCLHGDDPGSDAGS